MVGLLFVEQKYGEIRELSMRVGFGFEVYPLVENRPLIIGDVQIPFEKGMHGAGFVAAAIVGIYCACNIFKKYKND